jgi:hypothetical protein
MDVLTKIVIPLCTFFLGIVITILLKKYEQKKAVIRRHAEETAALLKDWYNQLHTLQVASRTDSSKMSYRRLVNSYVQERSILPKVLLNLTVLKSYKESRQVVKDIEDFLALLTTFDVDTRSKY